MNDYLDYLQHHGIKGMKWGIQNGPPYPLSDEVKKRNAKNAVKVYKYTEKKLHGWGGRQVGKAMMKYSGLSLWNTYYKNQLEARAELIDHVIKNKNDEFVQKLLRVTDSWDEISSVIRAINNPRDDEADYVKELRNALKKDETATRLVNNYISSKTDAKKNLQKYMDDTFDFDSIKVDNNTKRWIKEAIEEIDYDNSLEWFAEDRIYL